METYYIIKDCLGDIEIDTHRINLSTSHSSGEHCTCGSDDVKEIKSSLTTLCRNGLDSGNIVTIKKGMRANKSIREMFYG